MPAALPGAVARATRNMPVPSHGAAHPPCPAAGNGPLIDTRACDRSGALGEAVQHKRIWALCGASSSPGTFSALPGSRPFANWPNLQYWPQARSTSSTGAVSMQGFATCRRVMGKIPSLHAERASAVRYWKTGIWSACTIDSPRNLAFGAEQTRHQSAREARAPAFRASCRWPPERRSGSKSWLQRRKGVLKLEEARWNKAQITDDSHGSGAVLGKITWAALGLAWIPKIPSSYY